MTEENHEKTPVRLVGNGIRTRDLPNASLVRYRGATSLGLKYSGVGRDWTRDPCAHWQARYQCAIQTILKINFVIGPICRNDI